MELTTLLILAFSVATQTFHLPNGLISAACYTESKYNVKAINPDDGGSPSIGVCQIKLETARDMGFKGTAAQLARPRTNVYYAAKYLRYQLDRYDGDVVKAVAAYNAGTYYENKKGLPVNNIHVTKVMTAWEEGR